MKFHRGFAETPEGQVHFIESASGDAHLPLVMIPQASANEQKRLMAAIGPDRRMIAIELLGMGDSDAYRADNPDMTFFAGATIAALSDVGLEKFDLLGTHQGARAAAEIAILAPDRVRKLILDGVGHMDDAVKSEYADHYLPKIPIDHEGTQIRVAWYYVRDSMLFWPWYKREASRSKHTGLPSAEILHDRVLDVLKSAHTIHKNMHATFAYDTSTQLPKVTAPTLVSDFDNILHLIPNVSQTSRGFYDPDFDSDEDVAALAEIYRNFLDKD
jgi:pimeloyl-ACP methyl ester carboxylesterase